MRVESGARAAAKKLRSSKSLAIVKSEPPNSQQSSQNAADELLSELTKAEIGSLRKLLRKKAPKFNRDPGGKLELAGDPLANAIRLIEAFATGDLNLVGHLSGQLADTVPYGERRTVENINFVVAALHSIGPRDGLEALLAVQMVGVHNIAMEFLKRAALKEQTDHGLDINVNRATRLLRTFSMQVEALKTHRSKGQQRVQVEHVHVHQGGQAIVGAVSHSATRGGDSGSIRR